MLRCAYGVTQQARCGAIVATEIYGCLCKGHPFDASLGPAILEHNIYIYIYTNMIIIIMIIIMMMMMSIIYIYIYIYTNTTTSTCFCFPPPDSVLALPQVFLSGGVFLSQTRGHRCHICVSCQQRLHATPRLLFKQHSGGATCLTLLL